MRRPAEHPPASCPICGSPAAERFRPFCSARCADVDLGNWLTERYTVPAIEPGDEEGDMPPDESGQGRSWPI